MIQLAPYLQLLSAVLFLISTIGYTILQIRMRRSASLIEKMMEQYLKQQQVPPFIHDPTEGPMYGTPTATAYRHKDQSDIWLEDLHALKNDVELFRKAELDAEKNNSLVALYESILNAIDSLHKVKDLYGKETTN